MKNDFRDYIAHSGSHLYVKKERTSSGKWKYFYPEDIKRDLSYAYRHVKSKITGNNKTFTNKVASEDPNNPGKKLKENVAAVRYEQIQRQARAQGEAARKKKVLKKKFEQMDVASAKKKKRSVNVNSAVELEKLQRQARAQGEAAKKARKEKALNNLTTGIKNLYSSAKTSKQNKETAKQEGIQNLTNFLNAIKTYSQKPSNSSRRNKKPKTTSKGSGSRG